MEMMKMVMWGLVLVMVMGNAIKSVHGITCSEVNQPLQPCLGFLTGSESSPSNSCCSGVAELNNEATTTEIRRQICGCFKQSAPAFGVDPNRAKQLPGSCRVQSAVPIDPTADCTRVA
ncbi:non-specific lipid-transfer protein 1-like [Mercurialis annua]|uniref:non-specific lipid-transfer protein 1-like n=1 Tax=Mercurialis annua TaxID=3986 RepID=UPI00215F86BC|nr:non-specific lipid-transfer protein 1-like [Mercurialis annua]